MRSTTQLLPERTAGGNDHHPPAPTNPVPIAVWRPWQGRTWLATAAEEAAFVRELAVLGEQAHAEPSRSDVTACLNALRCGLGASQALEMAPGLRPEHLYAAYWRLERARADAEQAWHAIVRDADLAALFEHGQAAAALLPSPIARLAIAARTAPDGFATIVRRLAANVEATRRDAHHIERALADCRPPSERGTELGNLLYNPYCDAVANRDDYLPERVGMLTPPRVAALLGEQRSDALDALQEQVA